MRIAWQLASAGQYHRCVSDAFLALIPRGCIARPSFVHWQRQLNIFIEFSTDTNPFLGD
jgi:hypothetical protein